MIGFRISYLYATAIFERITWINESKNFNDLYCYLSNDIMSPNEFDNENMENEEVKHR